MVRGTFRFAGSAIAVILASVPVSAWAGPVTIHVAPDGDDRGPGDAARPYRTLARAQQAVRAHNAAGDVTVILADGVYRLDAPLRFSPADGGQGRYRVEWRAADGAKPVLSGGDVLAGWTLIDRQENIWAAPVPKGTDSRQLYYDGVLLPRASVPLHKGDVTFDGEGMTIRDGAAGFLKGVRPDRVELHVMALWSNRYVPVKAIDGGRLTLQQPAWYNSVSNNDTVNKGHAPGDDRIRLVGACEFLRVRTWLGAADTWCIDPAEGRVYVKAGYRMDPRKASVVLPRLEALVSVSGDARAPIQNLSFTGLRFSHTTWMAPSRPDGYANVQTGAYIVGAPIGEPAPYGSCFDGCRSFEAKRELWNLIPAAVQVSRARNIAFRRNQFSQLGQVALGIGNDGGANLSGVDLGAQDIVVERNRFVMLGGGAILAGGVRKDAHHPSTDALRNANLSIRNNVITDVARDYRDNAAIFIPYFDGAQVVHNEISDAPYTAVAAGWSWGHNDVGGTYGLAEERGRFQFQPRYTTPTIMRNLLVANNRIENVGREFLDGGGIYTISAIPGTVVRENYLTDIGGNGLYVDQGSKFIRFERNVVDMPAFWLHGNNGQPVPQDKPTALRDSRYDTRWISPRTTDNTAIGNWHTSLKIRGDWIAELRNEVRDNVHVPDKDWPAEARKVIAKAGVEPEAR